MCSGSFIKPYCAFQDEGTFCVETWTCDKAAYADGAVCDCNCGMQDPDCDDPQRNTTCHDNFQCIAGKCAVPHDWSCDALWYADGKGCDCKCGAYDPDCDDDTAEVMNCRAGQVCNYLGKCVFPGCGNNRVDRKTEPKEQCDGGRGCDNCKCIAGYYPTSPMRQSCQPRCGDNITTLDEQCDGGFACVICSVALLIGCGNGVLDSAANESCDGGLGLRRRLPLQHRVVISSTVGSVCGVVLLVAAAAALRHAWKAKNGPRKINVPVEIAAANSTGFSTVDSGCLALAGDPLACATSGNEVVVPVVGADGAVYMRSGQATGGSDFSCVQLHISPLGAAQMSPGMPSAMPSQGTLEPASSASQSDRVPPATCSPALAEASGVQVETWDTADVARLVVPAAQQRP
eukprot:m51a1_g13275 putative serine-threonine protein (402) ;mRNA; r:513-2219